MVFENARGAWSGNTYSFCIALARLSFMGVVCGEICNVLRVLEGLTKVPQGEMGGANVTRCLWSDWSTEIQN